MELIKENYDINTIWKCPICGSDIEIESLTDDMDDKYCYFDTQCGNCGNHLTMAARFDHVCVWKEEE